MSRHRIVHRSNAEPTYEAVLVDSSLADPAEIQPGAGDCCTRSSAGYLGRDAAVPDRRAIGRRGFRIAPRHALSACPFAGSANSLAVTAIQ
jgi:hypothetical protein